jgi:hypothetical protein
MTEGLRQKDGPDGRGSAWSDQPCSDNTVSHEDEVV